MADLACVSDFTNKLPDKLQTKIGENGMKTIGRTEAEVSNCKIISTRNRSIASGRTVIKPRFEN